MNNKPICLITGSSGLIGSETANFFLKKNFNVIGIDNNFRQFFFGKSASTIQIKNRLKKINNYSHFDIDIRNFKKLFKIFKKYKNRIKLIVHCAAQPSHDWAYQNPMLDFDINAKSTFNLLELTKIFCPKSVFIFVSTNKVYGDNPNKFSFLEKKNRYELKQNNKYFNGIDENLKLDGCIHSFFGSSKLSADILVQEYGNNFGIKTVCFRGGCLTGSSHRGAELHGFLSYLVKTALNKKVYKVFGFKGKQVRDNLHSSDLVNAFWEFYKKPKIGKVYNIGGSRKSNCSILEAVYLIESFAKIKVNLKLINKARVGDHIWWITNNSKFKKDYPNWKQNYDIKKIIKELIKNNDG
ncbi:NAD-dependent epimerase/dehydratase family protein [Candidatus Pelagibacter sp.]|nr:NAD-dependent epimerase/dehydratase family protein [Candidatus Pelagibacter sp.]